MSIEIDILNGDASWRMAEPLHQAVFGPDIVAKQPWAHVKWANADLRVLIETPEDGLVCHVGIYFRTVTWNGQKVHIGGIGGVCTREDRRGRGYATMAIDAAVHTMRANEAVRFALLFCEPHNVAFYEARSWLSPSRARSIASSRRGGSASLTWRPMSATSSARRHSALSTSAACPGEPCVRRGWCRGCPPYNMSIIIQYSAR
ncbi:putative acetyltransferase [Bradyrhizobium sp. GM0.4]